jgi:hypothetical protein
MYHNACFISYKHPVIPDNMPSVRHFWLEFVEEFQKWLESYLTVPIRSYRDDRLASHPGIAYPRELSQQLCKSVCLVAILVPEYWESDWCLGEWKAMEQLEQDRLGQAGLIIPILFRGDRAAFEKRVDPRVLVDFSHIVTPSQLGNVKNRIKIEQVANVINNYTRRLKATHAGDCERFKVQLRQTVVESTYLDPDPFAQ